MNRRQAIYYGARLEKMQDTIKSVRFRADSEGLRVKCDDARRSVDEVVEYLESLVRADGKG